MTKVWSYRAMPTLLLVPLVVVLLLIAGGGERAGAAPDAVAAGYDLFETDASQTYIDLPPDFFGPGCSGVRAFLAGVPFDSFDPDAGGPAPPVTGLLPTDTIVQRLAPAGPVFPDTIPIEIVALSLTSATPITVTCPSGPQTWTMTARILESPDPPQTTGSMIIRHDFRDGGTFNATLPVTPRLTFSRIDGPGTIGPTDGPTLNFVTTPPERPWCHTPNPLDDPAGHVVVESPGLTSNFFPGVVCPDSEHRPGEGAAGTRTKVLVGEDARLAAHGVRVSETKPPIGGVTELAAQRGDAPATSTGGSGLSAGAYAAIAAGAAAAALLVLAGGWYGQRRFRRGRTRP